MAESRMGITVDIRGIKRDLTKLQKKTFPEAMARAFRGIANTAREDVKIQTRRVFRLHSDYIPKGVLSTPFTAPQLKAGAKAIVKYHDIQASVFLRPASSPKKSLNFMIPHETGESKKSATGGSLAIPSGGIENYRYKTARGSTAKRWQPENLLKEYRAKGPNRKGRKLFSRKKGRKGEPFLMRGKSGTMMIVRRSTPRRKPLEFLYSFKKQAKIKPRLLMEDTVNNSVQRHYAQIIRRVVGGALPR